MIELNSDQKELLELLINRWRIELETNLAELDITMPEDLRPMMELEIRDALDTAKSTLEWLHGS
jgi:hypothetical protein